MVIFISLQDEDTRRNIVSHFHEALKQKKVETFMYDGLQEGDDIPLGLKNVIKDSLVSVIFFTKDYASSKRCLCELDTILECKNGLGQIVIPVFYNIDPSDVRKQTGSYGQAFVEHEGDPRCDNWKADLTEAANLVGYDLQKYRTESEFVKSIVGDVLQKLASRYPKQPKDLVGIESIYGQIEPLLKMGSSELRILGIWGMGGIGKTAIADALYGKWSDKFEVSCFIPNVREESNKDGLEALCNKLYSKLLPDEIQPFDVPHIVSQFDIKRLGQMKVLIVLDDVDTSAQLEELMKCYRFIGPGSRVIVTTRNRKIFSHGDEIYEVKKLDSDHSLQLLCLTVGEQPPKHEYEDLLESAIFYCKGNPLALKSVGERLRKRSKVAWKSELGKVQKILNRKIHDALKPSYEGLDCLEQDIFLDIACFFTRWDRDRLTSLLHQCDFFPEVGIEDLLDKALITISNGNWIEMHDLIRQMGQEIVRQESIREPGRRSRLWNHEEVLDVLKNNKGTEVVEGIILDLYKLIGDLPLSSDSFAKMPCLRFLQIHGWDGNNRFNVCLPSGLESLPNELRYLHWDGFCVEYLPANFCAEQLVELHMTHSKLKKLWDGKHQNLVNLKQFDLSYSPDFEILDLSKAEKLESVSLGYCESLCQLHVHSKSLCALNIYGCSSLKEFLLTSEETTSDLSDTAICALPSSIWGNRKLAFLCVSNCENRDFVGNKLSDDPGMGSMWFLQALPHNIGHSLTLLDQCGNNVESLPANIKSLSMMRKLQFDDCGKLVSLLEFTPSLEEVSAFNCSSLGTDSTQLWLQQMLQSRIPYIHEPHLSPKNWEYFFFLGDHVTDECGFHTAESSTTTHLP